TQITLPTMIARRAPVGAGSRKAVHATNATNGTKASPAPRSRASGSPSSPARRPALVTSRNANRYNPGGAGNRSILPETACSCPLVWRTACRSFISSKARSACQACREGNFMSAVTIVEVAPRDGFQSVREPIPTDTKVRIVEALAATGLQRLEIGSFVSPKAIPQMADTAEVLKRARLARKSVGEGN